VVKKKRGNQYPRLCRDWRNMKLFWFLFCLLLVGLCGCSSANGTFLVSSLNGDVLIKSDKETNFSPLQIGSKVGVAAQVTTAIGTSYVQMDFGEALLVIGPNTRATVERVQGKASDPKLRILLEKGGVLVAAKTAFPSGYFEVRTVNGTASIHGSAMVVSQDTATALAQPE
jgi:hypothetical protein